VCVVGCIASVSAGISTTVGWVGGRDSWVGPSSISVSLLGAGGSRGVDLVFATIIIQQASTEKNENEEIVRMTGL
jgi:hypothetical protein